MGRKGVATALLRAQRPEQDPEVIREHIRLTLWFLLAFQSRRLGRSSPPTPLSRPTEKAAPSFRHPRNLTPFLRHLLSAGSRHLHVTARTWVRGIPDCSWPVYGHI